MPSSKIRPPDTAVILAGGAGTRLGPLTARTPKPLLPVAGRPFLHHILDYLLAQEIKRVVLATGYLADEFETVAGSGYRNLSITFSREETPLGTGGGLALALAKLDESTVLALNGDTFFPVDLAALAKAHRDTGAAMSLALRRIQDVARYGHVTLEGERVTALHEKGGSGPGLINGGIYLVDRARLLADAPGGAFSLEHDLFPRWIAGGQVAGVISNAYFIDIGAPEDLQRSQREMA